MLPIFNSDAQIYVEAADDVDVAELGEELDALVADLPTVVVQDLEEFTEAQTGPINTFLTIVYGLLGLAIIIALIGIANTLSLSVLERTRELGLLRAVGMSRRQLKRMVRTEAAIIAVFGTLIGLVIGIVFSIALTIAISADTPDLFTYNLPVVQLVDHHRGRSARRPAGRVAAGPTRRPPRRARGHLVGLIPTSTPPRPRGHTSPGAPMSLDLSNLPTSTLEFLGGVPPGDADHVRADGSPHVVPVGFSYDPADRLVRIITRAGSQKVANARRGGRAAVSQVDGGRWLTLEGTDHRDRRPRPGRRGGRRLRGPLPRPGGEPRTRRDRDQRRPDPRAGLTPQAC